MTEIKVRSSGSGWHENAEGDVLPEYRPVGEYRAQEHRLSPPEPRCPFLQDPELFRRIAEELKRGVDPEVLEDLGLGAEPSPLGGTLASDMDPEEIL